MLCSPFSENKIKGAMFHMEKNKAARPDKIPIEFYQSYWDIVKNDIIQLFNDFYENKVDISSAAGHDCSRCDCRHRDWC